MLYISMQKLTFWGVMVTAVLLFSSIFFSNPEAYYMSNLVRLEGKQGMGTGFYVRTLKRTYILTNAHVCELFDNTAYGTTVEGVRIKGKILKRNKTVDLCLIDSDNHKGLPLAQEQQCSEWVYTAGYANGGKWPFPMTSKLCDHVFENFVIPGQSGSPVVNNQNLVVGVVMARELDRSIGYVVSLKEIKTFLEGR